MTPSFIFYRFTHSEGNTFLQLYTICFLCWSCWVRLHAISVISCITGASYWEWLLSGSLIKKNEMSSSSQVQNLSAFSHLQGCETGMLCLSPRWSRARDVLLTRYAAEGNTRAEKRMGERRKSIFLCRPNRLFHIFLHWFHISTLPRHSQTISVLWYGPNDIHLLIKDWWHWLKLEDCVTLWLS